MKVSFVSKVIEVGNLFHAPLLSLVIEFFWMLIVSVLCKHKYVYMNFACFFTSCVDTSFSSSVC